MTPSQAVDLRIAWQFISTRANCSHRVVELEMTESGYLTGSYLCTVCGERIEKKAI